GYEYLDGRRVFGRPTGIWTADGYLDGRRVFGRPAGRSGVLGRPPACGRGLKDRAGPPGHAGAAGATGLARGRGGSTPQLVPEPSLRFANTNEQAAQQRRLLVKIRRDDARGIRDDTAHDAGDLVDEHRLPGDERAAEHDERRIDHDAQVRGRDTDQPR